MLSEHTTVILFRFGDRVRIYISIFCLISINFEQNKREHNRLIKTIIMTTVII